MGFFDWLTGGKKEAKVSSGDKRVQDLLDLVDRMRVTSLQVSDSADMQKLLTSIKLLTMVAPPSKETFIAKGFELARSSDRFDKMKGFQLLSLWVNEDPRVDRSFEDGTFEGMM